MTIHDTLIPSFHAPILEHLPDALLWVRPVLGSTGTIEDFEIGYTNSKGAAIINVARDAATGVRLLRDHTALHDQAGLIMQHCSNTLTGGQAGSTLLTLKGRSLELNCTAYEGGVLCTLRSAMVLGEAVQQETEKLRSLKWMVDNAPVGMVMYEAMRDAAGTITDFRVRHYNKRSNELLGITEEQRQRYTFRQVLEVLGIGYVFEYYISIVETGAVLHREQYIDNINRWLFVSTMKLDDGFVVMHTDVSELKASQRALEEHTSYLNNILNTSLNAVVVMEAVQDTAGQITEFVYRQVNHAFTQWAGKSETELLHRGMLELFPTTKEAGIFQVYHDVIMSGAPRHVEVPFFNGQRQVWLDLRIAPLGARRAVGTFTDITPRKEAFAQIQQQKTLLDNILKYSSNGIAVSEMIRDKEGKVIDSRTILANEAASRFTGLPLDIYLTKTANELDPNIMNSDYYRACVGTLETGEPILTRYFLEFVGRWLELSVSKMDNDRLIHMFTDVTPTKEAELKLEAFANMLKAVFNAAQTGMFTFAPAYNDGGELVDFRFVMVNPSIAAYVNEVPEHLEGSLGSQWFPGYLTNGVFDMYKHTYLTGEPSRKEVHYRVDGFDNYLDLQCVKLDEHLLISFTDHTPLRKVQAQLERTVEDLRKMNANLEQFAYSASHDLKEPLRKINFFSERLRERLAERISEEERDLLSRMEKACQRMNILIDDLLEYSRVSRGAHQLEQVALNDILRTVLENLELNIQEKGAQVTAATLPVINGHRQQLQQLFQNLVENALKYRHPDRNPQILITAQQLKGSETTLAQTGVAPDRLYHLITVSDNGIGFDQEDAERIFQVFTRLHGRSEYAGTGVGLSIARKVVENHHGHIWATAQQNEGAVFHVLLPA